LRTAKLENQIFFLGKKFDTQDGSRKPLIFFLKVKTKVVLTHGLKEPEPAVL
jgi:hypothetical protein